MYITYSIVKKGEKREMKNIGQSIILLFMVGAIFYAIMRAKSGKLPKIRSIAALDALEEGVGRAVEMGRPVHFFLAAEGGLFSGTGASAAFAALAVLSQVSKLTASKDAGFICSCNNPEVSALAVDVSRAAYASEGKMDSFKPEEMVRYFASVGYKEAISGYLMREKPAASIMMGDISNEAVLLADVSSIAGCLSIAGCQRNTQAPFLVALCDYVMVGEELLVAGAYLTKDPLVLGSIQGQDMAKLLMIGMAIAGATLATFKINAVTDFFNW